MSKLIVQHIDFYNKNFYNEPVLYRDDDTLIVKFKTNTYEYEPYRTDIEKELNKMIDKNFFKIKISNDNIIILTFKENDVLYNFNQIILIIKKFKEFNIFIKYKNLRNLGDILKPCLKKEIKFIQDQVYGKLLMIGKNV